MIPPTYQMRIQFASPFILKRKAVKQLSLETTHLPESTHYSQVLQSLKEVFIKNTTQLKDTRALSAMPSLNIVFEHIGL